MHTITSTELKQRTGRMFDRALDDAWWGARAKAALEEDDWASPEEVQDLLKHSHTLIDDTS